MSSSANYERARRQATEYVWMGNVPVAVLKREGDDPARLYYILTDHLGTPRQVVDSRSNAVVWEWFGEPFGTGAPDEDPGQTGRKFTLNLRYAGQYYDRESGLFHNGYRDYNPQLGRYVESDPIGLKGGINTYAYVGGNPVSRIDLLGLWTGQLGLGFNVQIGPINFSFSGGIAFDGYGNVAPYYETPVIGLGTGAGVSGGFVIHGSNGDNIQDLNGPFTNVNAGGGWGVNISGDGFYGAGSQGQNVEGGGITIGAGVGGSSSTTITNTSVGSSNNVCR